MMKIRLPSIPAPPAIPLKTILLILLFFPTFAISPVDQPWDEIQQAIRQGDAQRLSSHFGPTLSLSLPGHQGHYSNRQAKLIFTEFFRNNPPAAFVLVSQGKHPSSDLFYLGRYTTGKNSRFSVYILIRTGTTKTIISQITFEKI